MNTMISEPDCIWCRSSIYAWIVLFVGALGLVNASANDDATSSSNDEAAVRAVVEGIIAADNVENIERVIGYYADDAILLAPDGADVVGQTAIRDHYRSLFASVDLAIQSRIDDIAIAAGLAVVRGLNTVSAIAAGSEQGSCTASKDLMTLERRDVEWKISQLMWSNQPIPC